MSAVLLRKAIKDKIQINPFSLSGDLYPTIDNGYGSNIENLNGSPVETEYTNDVRIFRKKKNIKQTNDTETPYTYENIYYILSDYETVIDINLIFLYNNIKLKVLTREPLLKFGSIIGYQYELDEITEVTIG